MRSILVVFLSSVSIAAQADVPRVAVDIAPVHGLVASVMGDLGAPDLVIPPGASPHGYAMRPSEARMLSGADVVFWIGPVLTPWLAEPVETLAPQARHVALADTPGLSLLSFRQDARFEPHDHGHDHGDDDAHAHADGHADDHGHGEDHTHDAAHAQDDDHAHDHAKDAHDDHAHAHDEDKEGHGHAHSEGGIDGHVWLDPDNAAIMLAAIAATLAEMDPANAETYRNNAAEASAEIEGLKAELAAQLAPVAQAAFIVSHDSYHYFERSFGLQAVSSIALADESGASAGRLSEVREVVAETGAVCALAEPRSNRGLIEAVERDVEIRVETLDAIGIDLEPGAGYYPALLRQIADGLSRCLAAE